VALLCSRTSLIDSLSQFPECGTEDHSWKRTDVMRDGATGVRGHQSQSFPSPSLALSHLGFLLSFSRSFSSLLSKICCLVSILARLATTSKALINAVSSSDQCYGNNDPGARRGILSLASSLDPSFSYTAYVVPTLRSTPPNNGVKLMSCCLLNAQESFMCFEWCESGLA